MGLGNIKRKQFIKGILFFLSEIIFIAFMILDGTQLVRGLMTLGTKKGGEVFNEQKQVYEYTQGDNSMLFLFYGLLAVFAIIFFIILWVSSAKSGYSAQLLEQ